MGVVAVKIETPLHFAMGRNNGQLSSKIRVAVLCTKMDTWPWPPADSRLSPGGHGRVSILHITRILGFSFFSSSLEGHSPCVCGLSLPSRSSYPNRFNLISFLLTAACPIWQGAHVSVTSAV